MRRRKTLTYIVFKLSVITLFVFVSRGNVILIEHMRSGRIVMQFDLSHTSCEERVYDILNRPLRGTPDDVVRAECV